MLLICHRMISRKKMSDGGFVYGKFPLGTTNNYVHFEGGSGEMKIANEMKNNFVWVSQREVHINYNINYHEHNPLDRH